MAREFEFVQSLQRYRVTEGSGKGQFISAEAVQSLTLQYLDQGTDHINALSDRLITKDISLGQWEREVAATLKDGWINAWAIGIGGHKNFSQSDYGAIGSRLRQEYQYLRNFTNEILLGNLSEAQIRDRTRKYIDGFYTAYAHAQDHGHARAGFTWQKDTLDPGAKHCSQCVAIASMGWVPRGSTPRIGGRLCHHRDRCTREWSKEVQRPDNNFLKAPFGFIGVPKQSQRLPVLNNRQFRVKA